MEIWLRKRAGEGKKERERGGLYRSCGRGRGRRQRGMEEEIFKRSNIIARFPKKGIERSEMGRG